MALVLGTYQPDIQCGKSLDTWKSCRSIIVDMPALTTPEIFGPQDDPAVQVLLPQFLKSGMCCLSLASPSSTLTIDMRSR